MAVMAQSVLFSPLGAQQNFVASNPNPTVALSDPLPGVANYFTGADSSKWVTGVHRYSTARLSGIYAGIDAEYLMSGSGQLTLRLILQAGTDPKAVVFQIPTAMSISGDPSGGVTVYLGFRTDGPFLPYPAPVATEQTAAGQVSISANFQILSTTQFGLQVSGQTGAGPLQIDIQLIGTFAAVSQPQYAVDAAGNTFAVASVADAAGKDDPFPSDPWVGCGILVSNVMACFDVAVYKFSKAGDLVFVSYLAGRTEDLVTFLGLASDGAVVVTGTTDSSDFPVTAGALQRAYGGPPAVMFQGPIAGDFFASRMDQNSGALLQSTYFGGPNADSAGQTALGADGSVYFIPKYLSSYSGGLPTTSGALIPVCPGNPCASGYAAHLSPALDKLLYGTYLPGGAEAAQLYTDGSVYYAGSAAAGFPTTPGAYQTQNAGGNDGIVARLDPSGTKLLFATYVGGPNQDGILNIALSPDGSVWASVSSSDANEMTLPSRLVHLDASGQRLLADTPLTTDSLQVDPAGNLIALAEGNFTVSPNALQADACGGTPVSYVKLSPTGHLLFTTYLPFDSSITGLSSRGLPILQFGRQNYEIDESQPNGVFAGCMVDAASFNNADVNSPGEIVTLFGSGMGPQNGVSFQLTNGELPTLLGGTQVLVNGQPAPLLYSSYWQVNAILPYSLPSGPFPTIQVVANGGQGNSYVNSRTTAAYISLFRTNTGFAAALNEDGTVNSPANPAKGGSRVVLFGTGGGQTMPASTAGEVTPLEKRPLQGGATVSVENSGLPLTVEYAGAAPGLVAGVTQINIKLPDFIPQVMGFPAGVLPLVISPGPFGPPFVTVAVVP